MKITKEEILNIAKLSRLELIDEQVTRFGEQISNVLEYVDKLNEVDVSGVEETSQVTGLVNVYRQDEVEQFNKQEDLVKQAADSEDNQVKVHNVL